MIAWQIYYVISISLACTGLDAHVESSVFEKTNAISVLAQIFRLGVIFLGGSLFIEITVMKFGHF